MKKMFLALGIVLTVGFISLIPSVSAAATEQEWTPVPTPTKAPYIFEENVPEDVKNTLSSALEAELTDKKSSRYLYVASLPETTNIQTAARSTAEAWELDSSKASLVFYDTVSTQVFVWPATDENVELTASFGSTITPDEFSSKISSIYENTENTYSLFDSLFSSSFFTVLMILAGLFMGLMLIAMLIRGFYYF